MLHNQTLKDLVNNLEQGVGNESAEQITLAFCGAIDQDSDLDPENKAKIKDLLLSDMQSNSRGGFTNGEIFMSELDAVVGSFSSNNVLMDVVKEKYLSLTSVE